MRQDAEEVGAHTIRLEAPEGRSLPALLAPQLRIALLRLSKIEKARSLAQRGLRGLAGFVGALKLKFNDIEVGLDFEPELRCQLLRQNKRSSNLHGTSE